MKYKFFILAGLIIILAVIFAVQKSPHFIYKTSCGDYEEKNVEINGKILNTIISDTDCKKSLGLSGMKKLENNEGMLFLFDKAGYYGFWMKDMNFSIDILWISDDFKVAGIEKIIVPETYPEVFGKNYLARYVLELPAGYADKNNIKVGDKIILSSMIL